jgi:hypothetical protein
MQTTQATSEVEDTYIPPTHQLMENPVTGEWEVLSVDEWLRLRAGLSKHDNKTPMVEIVWRAGLKCAIGYAIGKSSYCDTTIQWIKSQLASWKINTGAEFHNWIKFIAGVYDLDTLADKHILPYIKLQEVAIRLARIKAERQEAQAIRLQKWKNKQSKRRSR